MDKKAEILNALQEIAQSLIKALQTDNTSYLKSSNISGDTQLAIDCLADKMIEEKLLSLDSVCGICSEEKEEAKFKENLDSGFLVAYDPLDGSSLFDSNLSVGSIFGFYEKEFKASNLKAAAYIVYGPRLELVFAYDEVCHYFFNGESWKKLDNLALNEKGKLNAPGGTQKNWSERHKNLVDSFFKNGYRLRYSGGMVPDLHQILVKKGGIFSYPATSDAPNGKLRKLFEVFPFAFIYELAGGLAINGESRLLDLDCKTLHETTPCFFGSKCEIDEVVKAYK